MPNLPSRYARNVNRPINAVSNMNSSHDSVGDHERIRCSTKILENTRADCHAWNLFYISTARKMLDPLILVNSPNIITLVLQNQQ